MSFCIKNVLEWVGCALGLAGSLLLALHIPISGLGFALFLTSNLCWAAYAIKQRAFGLLTMQAGYTATSLLGLYNWFGL